MDVLNILLQNSLLFLRQVLGSIVSPPVTRETGVRFPAGELPFFACVVFVFVLFFVVVVLFVCLFFFAVSFLEAEGGGGGA